MSDAGKVTIARKSYDHLLRTRDRALNDAKWQREQVDNAHRWAQEAFAEQRRLADRLDRVVAAAASIGVSIQDINAALDLSTPPSARACLTCGYGPDLCEQSGCPGIAFPPALDTYLCPTSGEVESRTRGGFDVCCDNPTCPSNPPASSSPEEGK